MRLPGESEERNARLSMKYMMMGVSLSILLILGVVVYANKQEEERKAQRQQKGTTVAALEYGEGQEGAEALNGDGEAMGGTGEGESAVVTEEVPVVGYAGRKSLQEVERLYQENKLTASDLDFWDMYPEEPQYVSSTETGKEDEKENDKKEEGSSSRYEERAKQVEEEEAAADPSKDGKHTLLTYADGTEEWVLINPYLEQNTYDYTNLEKKADQMSYYDNGRDISYLGADLSKYNGDVDFRALKEAGADFVMLRIGSSGYGSGQIVPDEKFEENIKKAIDAGLEVGVYFFSQAITAEEAVEESNYIIQVLANYQITYPVAFDMEYVQNDKARIEVLSRDEKTAVAKAFLTNIKAAGYKPLLYGTKEWLIKHIDLTKLTDFDVWLSQQKDIPDYPYKFQMWQYTLSGGSDGVDGDVSWNISFVDYSEK